MNEKIWFGADFHFGHKNILKFCPNTRLGKDVAEHDEIQIANWQRQVGQNDHVYLLGDVFFCDAVRARSIMRRLPGQKHLIYGNHDKVIKSNKDLRDMFVAVHDYHVLHIDGVKVVLFHFPIWEWDQMHRGSYHLFGHVHGNATVPGRAVDVGIDGELSSGDMSLYSWERVREHLSKKEVRPHHNKASM